VESGYGLGVSIERFGVIPNINFTKILTRIFLAFENSISVNTRSVLTGFFKNNQF